MHSNVPHTEVAMKASWKAQLRKGCVELCILAALKREELWGYALIQRISEETGIELSEGTIYPVLSRLSKEGAISMTRRPSSLGPSRRYYSLTETGDARLTEMIEDWKVLSNGIMKLTEELHIDEKHPLSS